MSVVLVQQTKYFVPTQNITMETTSRSLVCAIFRQFPFVDLPFCLCIVYRLHSYTLLIVYLSLAHNENKYPNQNTNHSYAEILIKGSSFKHCSRSATSTKCIHCLHFTFTAWVCLNLIYLHISRIHVKVFYFRLNFRGSAKGLKEMEGDTGMTTNIFFAFFFIKII